VGHVGSATGWVVFGWNGENLVKGEGKTLGEAYRAAVGQAGACGMLAVPVVTSLPRR
jgi:hypothetical protein